MKSRETTVAFLLCIAIAVMGVALSVSSATNAPRRSFTFTYVTRIPALPEDAKISRIWIPLPQSDRYQTIGNMKIETPFAFTKHRDPEYGNAYVYLHVPVAKVTEPAEVRVSRCDDTRSGRRAFRSHRIRKRPHQESAFRELSRATIPRCS